MVKDKHFKTANVSRHTLFRQR